MGRRIDSFSSKSHKFTKDVFNKQVGIVSKALSYSYNLWDSETLSGSVHKSSYFVENF